MISELSDLEVVARTLYGEARGEVAKVGVLALEAVASVIWNRWRLNPMRFGATPREVCLKPYQFSCWNANDPNLQLLVDPYIENGIYALCRMVAESYVLEGGEDVINGADHYHSIWIHPPSWALNISPVIDIGNHRFYQLS